MFEQDSAQHTEFAKLLSFWLEGHPISAPMLLSADTMNIFFISERN